jgi:outer membrane protein insertion porin family
VGLRRALGSDFFIGGVSYTLEDVGIQLNPGLHGPLLASEPPLGIGPLPIVVPANVPQDILAEQGSRLVSKIDAVLSYDTRNSTGLPTAGQRTETRFEVAGGPLGGDRNFYKMELGSAWYFKGLFPGHVLELGARAAAANSFGSTTNVPFFDRYFLGGIDSLRGYRYREVGPRSLNEPIGGDTSWFASAEYSVPIIERLRFAAFYDIGMVYYNPFSFSHSFFGTGSYNDNWGIGIRLLIPQLGPLRLDYGIPIRSDPFNRSHGRFQFSAGFERPF